MPYSDKTKDRKWHREYMRKCRSKLKMGVTGRNYGVVTPETEEERDQVRCDVDGNMIYDD
jgi:hypothetical protein